MFPTWVGNDHMRGLQAALGFADIRPQGNPASCVCGQRTCISYLPIWGTERTTLMKKLFITGGTGFFGKSILSMVKRGHYQDYEICILSRNPDRFLLDTPEFAQLPNVKYIRGDVRNFAFPNERFDCILHAGTPALPMPPGEQRDIILVGTQRVLEFARQCGAQKLMFVSSGAVYGPQPAECGHLPEDFPCKPVTEYGIAKLEAEQMCIASGIYTLIPRCFAFVGPYLNKNIHFAIGNFIRDAVEGRTIVINGDGTPLRSYMYADDLVVWLMTILENGENGVPYNVGSDEAISILDLARMVKSVLNSNASIEVRKTHAPGTPFERYVPSIDKARNELGLAINFPLKEAILKSV